MAVLIYEDEKHGYFDKITFASPDMKHPKDLQIEKNFFICPKDEYYCPEIFKTKINRKKIKRKKKKSDPIIKSSNTFFPVIFEEMGVTHEIGKNLNVEKWCKDENVKKLSVVDKFIIFTLQPKFRNQVFLAHNGAKFGKEKLLYAYPCKYLFKLL